jgi:uncharacterized protein YdhG (YjbR/CyaY superfamily)
MKKKSLRSSSSKKSIAPATVQEYIRRIPASSQKTFAELRAAILATVPVDAVETISYRIPAIRRGNILVWFAAFRDHCSLFPTASVVAAFKHELKNYSTSKGTVHFSLDKAIPSTLVKKLVKARVAENATRKRV